MKRSNTVLFSFGALLLIGLFSFRSFPEKGELKTLKIGEEAPMSEQKMADVSGKDYSLQDLKKENGLLVVFSCNTCPFVVGTSSGKEGWENRYNKLFSQCDKNGIGMVLVNSNAAKRKDGDNLEDMKSRAKEKNYKSFYVLDEGSQLANAFGARTTPHVFLFNKNMQLVYRGKIDDNVNSSQEVKVNFLPDAINNMVNGKPIEPKETKALGCSIKRVG